MLPLSVMEDLVVDLELALGPKTADQKLNVKSFVLAEAVFVDHAQGAMDAVTDTLYTLLTEPALSTLLHGLLTNGSFREGVLNPLVSFNAENRAEVRFLSVLARMHTFRGAVEILSSVLVRHTFHELAASLQSFGEVCTSPMPATDYAYNRRTTSHRKSLSALSLAFGMVRDATDGLLQDAYMFSRFFFTLLHASLDGEVLKEVTDAEKSMATAVIEQREFRRAFGRARRYFLAMIEAFDLLKGREAEEERQRVVSLYTLVDGHHSPPRVVSDPAYEKAVTRALHCLLPNERSIEEGRLGLG